MCKEVVLTTEFLDLFSNESTKEFVHFNKLTETELPELVEKIVNKKCTKAQRDLYLLLLLRPKRTLEEMGIILAKLAKQKEPVSPQAVFERIQWLHRKIIEEVNKTTEGQRILEEIRGNLKTDSPFQKKIIKTRRQRAALANWLDPNYRARRQLNARIRKIKVS